MDARRATPIPSERRRFPSTQRKSPSPFGPGLCGVGGRGEGMPITAGVGAERRPRPQVPEKNGGRLDRPPGARTNEAPRNACRSASPTAAVAGDYLPSPSESLHEKGDSEKHPDARSAPFGGAPAGGAAGDFVNHILGLDSGCGARQSAGRGRKSRGESSTRRALGWGVSIEIAEETSAGTVRREHFLSDLHRKCLCVMVPAIGNRGGV